MISSQEIVDAATASGLTAHVVEKDYVLGRLLWGVNASKQLSTSWIFKGGTCLKKCFFETYRFSEDLDFTLKDGSHVDDSFLRQALSEVCDNIYEHTGSNFLKK